MIAGSLIDYQKKAHETAIYPPDQALHYLIPGLLVEVLEMGEKLNRHDLYSSEQILQEAGDVLWFCAEILNTLNHQFILGKPDFDNEMWSNWESMRYWAQYLTNAWVKQIRDKNALVDDTFTMIALAAVNNIINRIAGIVEQYHTPILDVANMNLKKLADRQARNVLSGSGDNR